MTDKTRALRWRVTLATTLLGAVLSLLFAAATVYITEDYEGILVAEILDSQAQDYSLSLMANPHAMLPRSHRLSGYLRRVDGSGQVPAELAQLDPGVHEEDESLSPRMTVGVFDVAQGRLYFVMDLSDIEILEARLAYFLIAIVVLGTAFAAWLGWFLAGASLKPVRQLAAAVDALPTLPQTTALSALTGNDELGRLAQAIDRYQDRLVEADAEERRFFADASHELRTPIAVVRGVTELILDDPDAREEQRRWLARLDRGMTQITLLLHVLLGLARSREWQVEPVQARELVADSVGTLDFGEQVVFDNAIDPNATWTIPRAEAKLVLQAVLRRLIGTAPGGRLAATGSLHSIEFAFVPGEAAAASKLSNERGDTGVGMTLVNRLAKLLGWSVEFADDASGTRRAKVRMQGLAAIRS